MWCYLFVYNEMDGVKMKNHVVKTDNKNTNVGIIASKKMISIIGADCAGRLFENTEQLSSGYYKKYHCLKGFLKKTSQKYMRVILPYASEDAELCADVPDKKTKIKVAHKYGFIFSNYQDYEKYSKELEIFITDFFAESPEQTTDDTVFMMALVSTFIKFDTVYQLSCDKNDYKSVADNKNFANLTDNYTNEFFTDVSSVFTQTCQQYGDLMQNIISAVIYSEENNNGKKVDFAKLFKQAILNNGSPYAGKSWGNGSAMRMAPVAYVAQSFRQGWNLSELVVKNTHNNEESIKAARVVYTVGACSCYDLSAETIRKIIHFMFFDSKATGDLDENCADLCNFGTMEHRKNLKGASLEDIRNCDRKQLEEDIKKYHYSERAKTTVTLAVRIALTAESTEEAMRWVLEAGGDCDTLGIIVADMITKRCGISKAYADRMTKISLKTEYDKAPMNKQIAIDTESRKNSQEPECIVERVNDKEEFTYYNNLSDLFDKKFGHHYRENASIEWQLRNILELMNFLVQYKDKSVVENKDQFLENIFKDICSDIDFILNVNRECKVNAKEPVKLNAKMGEKNIFELLADKSDKEIIEMIKKDENIHRQLLDKLETEYEQTIYDHAVATAKFETDMRNRKLKNLTKPNIPNIRTEITKINNFISNIKGYEKIGLKPFVIQDYENLINQLKGNEEQEIQKTTKKETDVLEEEENKKDNKTENNTNKKQPNIANNSNIVTNEAVKTEIEANNNAQREEDKESSTSGAQLQQNDNGKLDENLVNTNKTNTDNEYKPGLQSLEIDAKDTKDNEMTIDQTDQEKIDNSEKSEETKPHNSKSSSQIYHGDQNFKNKEINNQPTTINYGDKTTEQQTANSICGNTKNDKTATSQMQQRQSDQDNKVNISKESNKAGSNINKIQPSMSNVEIKDADVPDLLAGKDSNSIKGAKTEIEINDSSINHNVQHEEDKKSNTSKVQLQQNNNCKLNEKLVNTSSKNKSNLQLLETDVRNVKNDKITTGQIKQKYGSQNNKCEDDKNQLTDKPKLKSSTVKQYKPKKYLVWGFWTGSGVCVIVIVPSFVLFSSNIAAAIAISTLCIYLIAMLILRYCTKQPEQEISNIASEETIQLKLDEAKEQAKKNEADITNERKNLENESNKFQ